jgi:hypothetical protein
MSWPAAHIFRAISFEVLADRGGVNDEAWRFSKLYHSADAYKCVGIAGSTRAILIEVRCFFALQKRDGEHPN